MTSGEFALLGAFVVLLVLVKPFLLWRRKLQQDARRDRLRRKALLESLSPGHLQKAKEDADRSALDFRETLEEEEKPDDG